MWISARDILKVIACSTPTRRIFSSTLEPGVPRSSRTAWSFFQPSVGRPSSMTMRSPVITPARSAGVSGSGATTVIQPSRTSIWMPRPPYSPVVCSESAWKSSGLR